MLTGTHIKVGLEEFCFHTGRSFHVPAGEPLRASEGVRLVQRLRPQELRRLRGLASTIARRSFDNDQALQRVLAELIANGRVQVRQIEAKHHRPSGEIPDPIDLSAPEPFKNEIADTHTVMIELIDAEGNPVPGEPFRIKLPDGRVQTSTLDDAGKAFITGIKQAGSCKVCFYKRDAAVWAPG